MSAKQKMYYVGFCRICGTGPLGLRRCGGCGEIAILCDECDAVWTDANLDAKPQSATAGQLRCPRCEASLVDAPSCWATKAQIEATNWLREALESGSRKLQQGSAFAPEAKSAPELEDETK